MIKFKGRKLVVLGAAVSLALSAFAGVQASNAATGSNCNIRSTPANASCDVITYAALQRVSTLDKLNPVGGYTESQMAYIVQGQLYRFAANRFPAPDLVTAETVSPDGLTITQTMRTMNYSDGTPVVAADAVNQFYRWQASKQSASYIAKVTGVVAKDAHTLVWTLSSPYPDFHFCSCTRVYGHPPSRSYKYT